MDKLLFIMIVIFLLIVTIHIQKTCSFVEHFTLQPKVYINFTTIPPRIKLIEPVLQSLDSQRTEKVFINIPQKYKRFNEKMIIPDFIHKYNVDIFNVDEDYGPLTKLMGPLLNPSISPDSIIIITDDDNIRDEGWANKLVESVRSNPNKVSAYQYFKKDIIWGALGFAFKKSLINKNDLLKFRNGVKDQCFKVDDHLLTAYFSYKKIPIVGLGKPKNDKNIVLGNALSSSNRKKDSEACREAIKSVHSHEFPFWCCVGCCPPSKTIRRI